MSRPDALIVAPNWIGDVVMAQPAMRAIALWHRERNERVAVTGRPWLADLLPYLDLPASFTSKPVPAGVGYLFPNSFGSAWRARAAGCRRIIGYRGGGRRLLLSRALPRRLDPATEHHRDYFLDLPAQLGIPIPAREVRLTAPRDARERDRKLLKAHGLDPERIIVVAPGAQYGGAKRYPPERWASVVAGLAEDGWQPVALGTRAEREIAEVVLHGVHAPRWNAAGETSLADALALIAASRLTLCNDSGFMHVAAGLGIPTVVPFGATDPARTSPSGPRVSLFYRPAPCSPCLARECRVPGQPCMANIPPALLLTAARSLLAG